MATHYVLCPCCGRNHCGETGRNNSLTKEPEFDTKEECRICRITNAYRSDELRDFGKNHSDCRFSEGRHFSPHYHRRIPGYGDAVDFDLRIHPWNCAGHSHCKHGMLGTIEERAITALKSDVEKYIYSQNHCVCKPQILKCHHIYF